MSLPCQSDGDGNDTLNRVGLCLVSNRLDDSRHFEFEAALLGVLQPTPGVYVRYPGGSPNNVSCDQLIPVLAYWARCSPAQCRRMWKTMWTRWGFAQNVCDGLGPSTRWQMPDLMVLRALPLFARGLGWWAPALWLADIYLLVLVLSDWVYLKTATDPVDINCTLATLYACKSDTLVAKFSWWLWPRLRPHIYADLQRYHRAEAGGNPWVAELWKGKV